MGDYFDFPRITAEDVASAPVELVIPQTYQGFLIPRALYNVSGVYEFDSFFIIQFLFGWLLWFAGVVVLYFLKRKFIR